VTVEEDVDKEDDVDDAVDGKLTDVVDGLSLERRVVRHHDSRVVGQHQDQPVPRAPEPRVVKHDVLRCDRRSRPIPRYYRLSVERQLHNNRTSHSSFTTYL